LGTEIPSIALWKLGGRLLVVNQEIATVNQKIDALEKSTQTKLVSILDLIEKTEQVQQAACAKMELRLSAIEARLNKLDDIVKPLGPSTQDLIEALAPRNKLSGPTSQEPLQAPLSLAPRLGSHHNAMQVERRNAMSPDQRGREKKSSD
jgi:hypothetical protein